MIPQLLFFIFLFAAPAHAQSAATAPSAELAQICRAPAQNCVPSFEACYQNYDCCSGLCQGGRCANISTNNCSIPGDYCRYTTDCCKGTCVRGQCSEDAPVGAKCNYDYQCRSGNCDLFWRMCLGSEKECARLGNPCRPGNCCSGNCHPVYRVCVSGTEKNEPRISGARCDYDFQCPQYCDFKTNRCI